MSAPIVDDGPITFTHGEHSATAYGAYLDDNGGVLYVEDWCTGPRQHRASIGHRGNLTTCSGMVVGSYVITGSWAQTPPNGGWPVRMASIRATIQGREYVGRCGYEWSQAVRLRRSRRKEG